MGLLPHGKVLRLPGFENVLVTAPTGSGKMRGIAMPNLFAWQGSVVVNDLKGELYQLTSKYRETHLNQTCYRWSPASEQCPHRYNPFYYVSDNPDLWVRDLQLISEILIPDTPHGEAFWHQSAREILVMLAMYLLISQGTATLAEIHDIAKQGDFIAWLKKAVSKIGHHHLVFRQLADSLINTDDKVQKNIIKDFHAKMGLFADPIVRHATSGNDFDVANLRKEKLSIYITIPDADRDRLQPLLTLFWTQLINAMTRAEPTLIEEPIPVLALMDEFGVMARIDKLQAGLSFLRSYRVRCILIVQHLGQLVATYGKEHARSFLNSKVKMCFTLNDIDDARYFSEILGKKSVKIQSKSVSLSGSETSHNHGRSYHLHSQITPLLTPDELMQMKRNKCVIVMEGQHTIIARKLH